MWFQLFIIITNVYYFIKKIHTEAKSIPFHYNQEYKINAMNSEFRFNSHFEGDIRTT